ncbi:unnamed protein product [Phaedon cochleariae]|uniref:Uncharacterized protein n=1 Tax=Phaedon cochleariae TaxID=80249 RepID=A0A9N9X1J3_PHACE|nr:unnamed protein product [Phaedon cochleariae]
MNKFSSFIELLVKQTCRRASHEFEMGSKHSSAPLPIISEHDATGIYSLQFLKSLHDKPKDNIYKLLKSPDDLNSKQSPNGLNWLNSSEFSDIERKTLLEFLKKVKNMSPSKAQNWIDLHHYMHYTYRNFVNPNPDPSAEKLSPFFNAEMKELVRSLLEEDESQLYLRVLALLREYCIFAQWNYSKCDKDHAITRLFYYYEAMLSAAKNLSSVFADLEVIIYKTYSVCWIDFNTCVFIRYFFETDFVQKKIYHCLETKMSPGDTPPMFGLLEDLKNLWIKEQKRIRKINDDHSLVEGTVPYYIEEAMIGNHKKVLTSNFWMERSQKEKDDLDLRRLDHHFFRLLSDPFFHPAGPILDRNGQCICEECLISKYECMLEADKDQVNEEFLRNVNRVLYCRRCQSLVDLESFHQHINSHAVAEMETTKPPDRTPLNHLPTEKHPVELDPDLLSTEETDKDDRRSTSEARRTTCDIHFTRPEHDLEELNCTKLIFEEFLKHKSACLKNEQMVDKNARNFIKIKKDIFKQANGSEAVAKRPLTAIPKKYERENEKVGLKNGMPPEKSQLSTLAKQNCDDEHEVEEATNVCQSRVGTCEHHKESQKCDCTYCEVFGTSAMTHTHQNNELRDRLRIRLHQRRDKRTKETCKNTMVNGNITGTNPAKVKTAISKVEERVPLPSSPTNIPPAPSVKSSDSSLATTSGQDDIHGLVNYIEGHTGMDKVELAQKKAAKKARQRMKKEEERIKAEEEQKRLAEEQRRKEAEKKKEQARKLAEIEKSKAAAEAAAAKALKELKKKSKKERQAEKRRMAQNPHNPTTTEKNKSNVIEETIPAMVTIKRVAETGSGTPTVTITLKGSTPDQDKLLYTLVNGSDDTNIEETKCKDSTNNNNSSGKKKKKQKKQEQTKPPQPAAIVKKEMTVTVELDPNRSNHESKLSVKPMTKNVIEKKKAANKQQKENKKTVGADDLPIPMLRLPPGITITKVEGPVPNRNYQVGNVEDRKGSTINVDKSGVIVVDTEKLIHNNQADGGQAKSSKTGKKNKKKKNKKPAEVPAETAQDGKKMITLKNPIFQELEAAAVAGERRRRRSEPDAADARRESDAQDEPGSSKSFWKWSGLDQCVMFNDVKSTEMLFVRVVNTKYNSMNNDNSNISL